MTKALIIYFLLLLVALYGLIQLWKLPENASADAIFRPVKG